MQSAAAVADFCSQVFYTCPSLTFRDNAVVETESNPQVRSYSMLRVGNSKAVVENSDPC